jgi:predicted ATPase
MTANLHIVTGAPGSGKTAILSGIRADVRFVGEPAREVLAQQRSINGGGTPERNPSLFVDLLLQRSIHNHEEAQRWGGAVLFDRGVPDCIAYAKLLGTDPEPSIRATAAYRYNREVLITRPWADIYTTDDERKMTFAATIEFQRLLESSYEQAGYTLVEVPRSPVEDRVAFVRQFIG